MVWVNVNLTGRAADNVRELIARGFASNEKEAVEVAILCYKYCKIDKTPKKCPILEKMRATEKKSGKI